MQTGKRDERIGRADASDSEARVAQHTPGPWQVSGVRVKLGSEDCQTVGPDGFSIAFLPIGRRPRELAGALADARLISASPDLLAVAREVIAVLYGRAGPDNEHLTDRETELWFSAREALTKAGG